MNGGIHETAYISSVKKTKKLVKRVKYKSGMDISFVDYSKMESIELQKYLYLKCFSVDPGILGRCISVREAKMFGVKVEKKWFAKCKDKQIPIHLIKTAAKFI